jgi:hypothetical protein
MLHKKYEQQDRFVWRLHIIKMLDERHEHQDRFT